MTDVIPFGERFSAAEYREWIAAQLTDREQLLVARAILDLPPARWRILGKQGYAVVTNRRILIVHADAAYSGRTRRPRYPHVREFNAVPPPEIAREVAPKDVALLPRSPDDRTVKMLIRGDLQRLRFRKPADAADFENALRSMSDKPEDKVRRAEQTLAGGLNVASHAVPLGVFIRVKPEAFVQALRDGRWGDVTTARDHDRIVETFMDALDQGADGILIGFALKGRPTRVVWADVEVIPAGIVPPEELPPDVPSGTRAFDLRLAGLSFIENPDPDVEPSQLRPSRFADRPWFLTDYPGRGSWTQLREAADQVLD
jgi:hypothetical protein